MIFIDGSAASDAAAKRTAPNARSDTGSPSPNRAAGQDRETTATLRRASLPWRDLRAPWQGSRSSVQDRGVAAQKLAGRTRQAGIASHTAPVERILTRVRDGPFVHAAGFTKVAE